LFSFTRNYLHFFIQIANFSIATEYKRI